jgi:nucleotide-binding universal stress UspA family protein
LHAVVKLSRLKVEEAMKIIVGIDTGGTYKSCLNLAARLRFPEPEFILAHAVDVTMPLGDYGGAAEAAYGVDYVRLATEAGEEALEKAEDDACAHKLHSETALLVGGAAAALVQYAQDRHADLVCVQSQRKGRLGSLFMGSTSRGLAIAAHCSVLVSKGEVAPKGDLKAVFATDHSSYADRALDRFLQLRPSGIKSVHVVTALHLDDSGGHFDRAALDTRIEEEIVKAARKRLDSDVGKLRDEGYRATCAVIDLEVNEALEKEMENSEADLLIMGAQGHGVMHRLLLGSSAIHQVVVEPYSVLIIRPDGHD